jgi:hypothetical protein
MQRPGLHARYLLRRYSGARASSYEARREGRSWQVEDESLRSICHRLRPRKILDCPVGTGRWIPFYREIGTSLVGVDFSADMLAEAARKVAPGQDVRLTQADVLDPAREPDLGSGYDLIVCSRFLHWVHPSKLALLVNRFAATEARFLLIGALVNSERTGKANGLRAVWERVSSAARELLRGGGFRRIHDEAFLLGTFEAGGWRVAQRMPIGRRPYRNTYFYLLEAARTGA